MKEVPAEELPQQFVHSLDAVVHDLFEQFPPPFDAARMAIHSPNFQYLMPKGLATREVQELPDYSPSVKYQLPDKVANNAVAGEISQAWSQQMVSEKALQTMIERGNKTGFSDRFKPRKMEMTFKGKPRSGLESLDEDYYYMLTYWLNAMGHKQAVRNCAHLIFDTAAFTGFFWYPRNGYMSWHTNENRPGYRFYSVYAREGNKSFFRYWCPVRDEIVTSWDKQGWNFRLFRAGVDDERLWHCIHSDTDRLSFGFTVHE